MKLKLREIDMEECWMSLQIPQEVFKTLGFWPTELEVDLSPLLRHTQKDLEQKEES